MTRSTAGVPPKVNISELELFHPGSHHKHYRGQVAGKAAVVKIAAAELPSAHAVVSMRHEFEILQGLNIVGIVRLIGLTSTSHGMALVLEDAGSTSIASRLVRGPFRLDEFLEISIQLASTIADLHAARVIHRDINPHNMVWDETSRRVTLVDFGMATTLPSLTIESSGAPQIEGTLAYISPEQTGRTSLSVDSRTDLYSLGASFFQMLTGRPPFASDDAIELVHAHIARRPAPPHELNTDVPIAISRVVLKLLEKEPNRRYQTAAALEADLREADDQWRDRKGISPFQLARNDVPRELSISDRLYGRDGDLRKLKQAFARARQGGRELLLVTGAPGVGKSALVRQLGPLVAEHRGLSAAGKFDLLQRGIPFSGLSQAFREIVRQLLTETEPELAIWRDRISSAVSPNGQLLIDILPELERIIGAQTAVPEAGPVETRNRFHVVFTQFLRVFAQAEHPLVLFLDDLQWADAATLQLLSQWIVDATIHHLLVIGAYRDNEVGPTHPLAIALAALRDEGATLDDIALLPIGADDVTALVSDVVNKDLDDVRPLAGLVMQKTAGNPFFVRRLLHLLHAEGLICFDPDSGKWTWDPTQLAQAPLADNVLDLMVRAIERLPKQTQALLEAGACIGHRFDLSTLAVVSGMSRTEATDLLWPAFDDGLLVPVRETYKAPRLAGPLETTLDALPGLVRFAHDRVQQAAYSLLGEERRQLLHLATGRYLLDKASEPQLDDRLFDIVDQLNLGEALLSDPDERLHLAKLNLAAGRKARVSAAYDAATGYLTAAMQCLPADAWTSQSDLTFAVHREHAECAYLTSQHERAETLIEAALEHAPSRIAKADLYSLRVLAATVASDWAGALRWGHQGLAVFGQEWPLDDLAAANEVEAIAVMRNVGTRKISDLVDAPEVEDNEVRACMRLLSILAPPAYFSGAEALTFLVSRATNLALEHGPSPYSAFDYALFAAIHNARTGQHDIGYAFGKLAFDLARRFGDRAEESRTFEVFGLVVHPWKAPLRDSLPLLREGFQAGLESGELAYAAFNLNSVLINSLPSGITLSDLRVDADAAIDFATRHKNRTSSEMAIPFRQFARALMGLTSDPLLWNDADFDEVRYLEEAQGNQTALGFYWVAKLQAAYLLGDFETARRACDEAAGSVAVGNLGMVTTVEHVFYSALVVAAELRRPNTGTASLEELRSLYQTLETWAETCPANFSHKTAIIKAEIATLEGADDRAMKYYRAAIDGAASQIFVQDEAIAHELRAQLFSTMKEPELSAVHLRAARERFHLWGAAAKVQNLERRHPDIFATPTALRDPTSSIDAMALVKASHTISAEREPERLFEQILRIAAELAGAQSGALVLCEEESLRVRARIDTAAEYPVLIQEAPLERETALPSAIFRYVLRLKEPLVVADAAAEDAFAHDPAVRQRQLRSVLCLPLMNQGTVFGLLYLENQTIAGAFTGDLVEVVRLLASQAAISLENSLLLRSLHGLTADLEKRVAERTQQLADEIVARDKAESALLQAQKMEAMGSLTGGVAHDFNNLLTPIIGSLDLLQRKKIGGDREQRLVDGAMLSAERAKTLVQRLLAFARRQPLQTTAVDMGALVAGMADLIASTSGPQIRVVVETAPNLPAARADAHQLEMALLNLSVNARDAMQDGGTLRISATAEAVGSDSTLKLRPGVYIRLSVADTGAGMDETTLTRAVEPFFSTKGVGKGTGLGLSMAHGLASQLGGSLTIQSRQGVGTNVDIWLPVSEVDVEPSVAAIPSAQADAAGSVLLVDDEDLVRLSTADMLTDLGYLVTEARSGEEALCLVRGGLEFDWLVTDHLMPGINGTDLARVILTERPLVRALVVSGYAESEGVAPDIPRLTKPFRRDELASSMAALAS